MSIYAMNWALRQRLDSPPAQILLYVIADSADVTGKTTHCDPDYMADRARMSRPTLFRRLGELEELGLLQRFKSYSEHGAQVYEIRLNFDCLIDLPIRGRRTDDDGDDAKTHSQTGETVAVDDRAKSQGETLVCDAKVSPVRQAEYHSGDSQEDPPISKDSPQAPQAGGVVPETVSDEVKKRFDYFLTGCLGYRTQSPDRPLAMFRLLTEAEQIACAAASPLHATECTRNKKKSLDAWKLIRERYWLRYPEARLPDRSAAPARRWVGGTELSALLVARRIASRAGDLRLIDDAERGRGFWSPRAAEPDLEAMARFAGEDPETWRQVELGSAQFAAWRDRLQLWLGGEIEAERIWLEPFDPDVHGRSASDPAFKLRRSINALRVPAPWPPHRDGTWPDDNSEGARHDD